MEQPWNRDGRTFADSLLRADLRAILHSMQGKVDLRYGLAVGHRMGQSVVHLCGVQRTWRKGKDEMERLSVCSCLYEEYVPNACKYLDPAESG